LLCPSLINATTTKCNAANAVCDCAVTVAGWSACASCGSGAQQTQLLSVTQAATNGGKACPAPLSQPCACNCPATDGTVVPCPVDCEQLSIGWTSCPNSCGGTQTELFRVLRNASFGGKACAVPAVRTCPVQPWCPCVGAHCPRNCSQSVTWGACNATCGLGYQTQVVTPLLAAANGGAACPAVVPATRVCEPALPPCDCQLSPWSTPVCSQLCGGRWTQTRTVIREPTIGGRLCGPLINVSGTCDTLGVPCPVDCKYQYDAWSACSVSCGGGQQYASIVITTPATNGGGCLAPAPTDALYTLARPCLMLNCSAPVDCEMTSFSPWSPCSSQCGAGSQSRFMQVRVPMMNGGKACPPNNTWVERRRCSGVNCPPDETINCTLSGWTSVGTCSKTCNGGKQTQTRTVIAPASNGGSCPDAATNIRYIDCNTQACDVVVDCVMVCPSVFCCLSCSHLAL
jgi:hypothetical protein